MAPITPVHHAFDRVVALFDDYRKHYGQRPSPDVTRAWLHDQLAHHRLSVAAAVRADQVCGFITTAIMPASLVLGTAWMIRDLYVVPEYRRSGIANALLQQVISDARAAGAQRLSLQTETDNVPALTLYTAVGFQPVTGLERLNLNLAPDGAAADGNPP